jgi:hypothetical protein
MRVCVTSVCHISGSIKFRLRYILGNTSNSLPFSLHQCVQNNFVAYPLSYDTEAYSQGKEPGFGREQ